MIANKGPATHSLGVIAFVDLVGPATHSLGVITFVDLVEPASHSLGVIALVDLVGPAAQLRCRVSAGPHAGQRCTSTHTRV